MTTHTVRRELLTSTILISLVLLLVFGLVWSVILFRWEMARAYEVLEERNNALNLFIDGFFSEIRNTVQVLSDQAEVQEAPLLDPDARQRALNLYASAFAANANIAYIYSGYQDGLLLINDYEPPDDYHPADRPWYQAAMASRPAMSLGLPYQEAQTAEWLLSTSMALSSEAHGYTGVIAIDCSIAMIEDLLSERARAYDTSYSLLTKPDGEVILHQNQEYLGRTISEIVEQSVSLAGDEGSFAYSLDGTRKVAFYSRCEQVDWVIVTVVSRGEIVEPILLRVLVMAVLASLVAAALGIVQSIRQGRRVAAPINQLRSQIESITRGDWDAAHQYEYPDNEIGQIAREVGLLTEREVYRRSVELERANVDLTRTVAELRELRSMIPICASCKRIRDDSGSWTQLEQYMLDHSIADFSHGICPECMKKLYPEYKG